MYNNILAPVNIQSDTSKEILQNASEMAVEHDAKLYVLHAASENIPEDIKEEEKDVFKQQLDLISDTVEYTAIIQEGKPERVIEETVQSEPIDLIVISSTNRNKLKKFILGSVTEITIKKVDIPVLVI